MASAISSSSATAGHSAVTIANSPPATSVRLSSTTPDTDATITAIATPTDPDGDPISLTYVWQVNGVTTQTITTTQPTNCYDLSKPGNGDYGDHISVRVTPNDGTVNGMAAAATATVTKPPVGSIVEYPLPAGGAPGGVTVGPDSAFWVSVEQSSYIEHVTDSGAMKSIPLPSKGNLGGITAGPDGNVWAAEYTADKIPRITTAGVITEFRVPTRRRLSS